MGLKFVSDWRRFAPRRMLAWEQAVDTTRELYRNTLGRDVDLRRPRRFSDKITWRKLFDLNPKFAIFCDKYATRQFVADRLGPDYLPELLWFGRDAAAIPFEALKPPYVLKSSHGYSHVEFVERGAVADAPKLTAAARQWLTYNHAHALREPGYEHVPPGLIVEALLLDDAGEPPPERKIFVFDGKVRLIQTIFVEPGSRERTTAFHTPDWTRLPWRAVREPHPGEAPRPQRLEEMLAVAEALAEGLDHLRVDIYDCGATFKVGELTAYSWSGLGTFQPEGVDETMGGYWRLPFPTTRAILTMLFRRPEIRRRAIPRDEPVGAVVRTSPQSP